MSSLNSCLHFRYNYTDRKLKQNQIKAEFVHKTQCKLSEENLNSYGHDQQFHQNHKNEQFPLTSNH